MDLTRRQWLAATPAAIGAGAALRGPEVRADEPAAGEPFGYCLNTSTISGQKRPIAEVIDIAAAAGYGGLEPWLRELDAHVQGGGKLADLKKRLEDKDLKVVSAIGFAEWAVDDEARRRKGLDQMRRDMESVRAVGGQRIAAPPVGLTDRNDADLNRLAERYRAILELGSEFGVVPQVEVWGFSKTLGRLGEAALVAIESGHPDACILADVYHLYKGGSRPEGLRLLGPRAMHVLHMNDYPADPPRSEIKDEHRVYPGDGSAPLGSILRDLRSIGFRGMLSLELFNRAYWNEDPAAVARTGLEKMRAAVRSALAKPS